MFLEGVKVTIFSAAMRNAQMTALVFRSLEVKLFFKITWSDKKMAGGHTVSHKCLFPENHFAFI